MSWNAREAGVATGTAYTNYTSKDELVVAAYRETKAQLAEAAMAAWTRARGQRAVPQHLAGPPTVT